MNGAGVYRGQATSPSVLGEEPTLALHRNARSLPNPPAAAAPAAPRPKLADHVTVGDRLRGGALSGGVRDDSIWVNCALLGAGVTVDLAPAQADAFAAHLTEWARRARAARTAP